MFSNIATKFVNSFFLKAEKSNNNYETLRTLNHIFKNGISGASWCLYITAVLMIASCIYYFYFERKRRWMNPRRIREIRNLVNKEPPKRRPGAVAREREIFQNVLKTAHSYIYPKNEKKSYVVRQTRSGTIYGQFVEENESS